MEPVSEFQFFHQFRLSRPLVPVAARLSSSHWVYSVSLCSWSPSSSVLRLGGAPQRPCDRPPWPQLGRPFRHVQPQVQHQDCVYGSQTNGKSRFFLGASARSTFSTIEHLATVVGFPAACCNCHAARSLRVQYGVLAMSKEKTYSIRHDQPRVAAQYGVRSCSQRLQAAIPSLTFLFIIDNYADPTRSPP